MVASALALMTAAMHIARTLQSAGLAARLEDTSAGALSAIISIAFAGQPYRVTVEPDHGPTAANSVYLPWALHDPRESPVQDPLNVDHPAYNMPCWVCGEGLGDDKPVQLIAIGADTRTERAKLAAGVKASVLHMLVHAECSHGQPAEIPEQAEPAVE